MAISDFLVRVGMALIYARNHLKRDALVAGLVCLYDPCPFLYLAPRYPKKPHLGELTELGCRFTVDVSRYKVNPEEDDLKWNVAGSRYRTTRTRSDSHARDRKTDETWTMALFIDPVFCHDTSIECFVRGTSVATGRKTQYQRAHIQLTLLKKPRVPSTLILKPARIKANSQTTIVCIADVGDPATDLELFIHKRRSNLSRTELRPSNRHNQRDSNMCTFLQTISVDFVFDKRFYGFALTCQCIPLDIHIYTKCSKTLDLDFKLWELTTPSPVTVTVAARKKNKPLVSLVLGAVAGVIVIILAVIGVVYYYAHVKPQETDFDDQRPSRMNVAGSRHSVVVFGSHHAIDPGQMYRDDVSYTDGGDFQSQTSRGNLSTNQPSRHRRFDDNTEDETSRRRSRRSRRKSRR